MNKKEKEFIDIKTDEIKERICWIIDHYPCEKHQFKSEIENAKIRLDLLADLFEYRVGKKNIKGIPF